MLFCAGGSGSGASLFPMRILLIASSYLPRVGGVETVTSQLAQGLAARGHTVEVIAARYPRKLARREIVNGIAVTRMEFIYPRWADVRRGRWDLFAAGFLFLPFTLAQLCAHVWRFHPDAVNLHFVGSPALFVLLARLLLRFRLVVSVHGDDVEGLARRSRPEQRVFHALMRGAAAVSACSQYLLTQAVAREPLIADKGRVIYNAVDDAVWNQATARGTYVLAVGRLVHKKGFDVLLRAFAQVKDAGLHLKIIGDGEERANLQALANDLGLGARVEFCGARSHAETISAMAQCRMLIIPSRLEPFGIVAIEAMALGKPVAAARVGGLPEILQDADAVLVESDNSHALAQGIYEIEQRLHADPNFGMRNRRLVSDYGIDAMTARYEQFYRGDLYSV